MKKAQLFLCVHKVTLSWETEHVGSIVAAELYSQAETRASTSVVEMNA